MPEIATDLAELARDGRRWPRGPPPNERESPSLGSEPAGVGRASRRYTGGQEPGSSGKVSPQSVETSKITGVDMFFAFGLTHAGSPSMDELSIHQ